MFKTMEEMERTITEIFVDKVLGDGVVGIGTSARSLEHALVVMKMLRVSRDKLRGKNRKFKSRLRRAVVTLTEPDVMGSWMITIKKE